MHIDWIDTYLDILETRNFNATAARLGLTQSTVSHRMNRLEDALGHRLFERGRAGALPSEFGIKFENHARNLRFAWQNAKKISANDPLIDGELRIGIQYDLARLLAGAIIAQLRTYFPKTAFLTEIDYSRQMTLDIASGILDFALIYTPRESADIHYHPLGDIPYKMYATKPMQLTDVTRADYIFPNYSPKFAHEHRSMHPHLDPCLLLCGEADMIKQYLHSLGGVSYLPATEGDYQSEGLALVETAPIIYQPTYFATHMRHRRSTKMTRALKAVETALSGLPLGH